MSRDEEYWNACTGALLESYQQSLWRLHADAVNKALIERWLPPFQVENILKTDLFDEAFGEGLYPLMRSHAQWFIGMDISSLILHAAKSRYTGLEAIAADVRRLPFDDGTFDIVVSNSTLDHFHTRNEIMTSLYELHRVMKPSGQLFISLDNPANVFIALRQVIPFSLLNRLGIVPYYVGATVGPYRLRKFLKKAGFVVNQMHTLMHSPRVFAVALSQFLERHASLKTQRRFLNLLMSFEHLSQLPTRFLTGHFIAAKAVKRASGYL